MPCQVTEKVAIDFDDVDDDEPLICLMPVKKKGRASAGPMFDYARKMECATRRAGSWSLTTAGSITPLNLEDCGIDQLVDPDIAVLRSFARNRLRESQSTMLLTPETSCRLQRSGQPWGQAQRDLGCSPNFRLKLLCQLSDAEMALRLEWTGKKTLLKRQGSKMSMRCRNRRGL